MSMRLGGTEKARSVPHTRLDEDAAIEKVYLSGGKLGAGSFGVVYEGTCLKTNKKWAIKIVNKEKAGSSAVKLLEREVSILKKVNHPHIIHLEEVFETPKRMYLVTELCDGGELSKLFSQEGVFSEADARTIIHRLTNAVVYLHKNDIVHRDIKLENILISSNPDQPNDRYYIKLTDFGLSVVKGGVGSDSMMQNMCGTPMYMAPEVIDNQGYSQQCDVWSIGVIAFLLMSGEPPFTGQDEESLYDSIRRGELNFSTKPWKKISEEAKNAIQGLLKVDPAHRLTAKELLDHPWITGDRSKPMNNGPTNVLEMMKQWKNDLRIDGDDDDVDNGDDVDRTNNQNGNNERHEGEEPTNNNVKDGVSKERRRSDGKTSVPSGGSKTTKPATAGAKKTSAVSRSKLSPTDGAPVRTSRSTGHSSASSSNTKTTPTSRGNFTAKSPHRTGPSLRGTQERAKPNSPKGGTTATSLRAAKKKQSGVS